MSGICGVVNSTDTPDVTSLLNRMLGRLRHHAWYRSEPYVDQPAGLGLGRMTFGPTAAAGGLAARDGGRLVVLMDGELYDAPETAHCGAGVPPASGQAGRLHHNLGSLESDCHAELLLHGYRTGGRDFFRGINGKFVAAIWDGRARRLTLVNDRFGSKPLYYAKLAGRLVFGSEMKAVLADADVPRTPNLRGLCQFFTFGQYMDTDTYLAEVPVLPPAGWLEYDVADGSMKLDRYWRLAESAGEYAGDSEQLLGDLADAFRTAVDRRIGGKGRLGVSLSGGLDSRTILAAIGRRVPVSTVTVGVEGCADHRAADQMARIAGTDHHRYFLDPRFLTGFADHVRWMVHLTDGLYLSECVIMPTLPLYRELGIDVLLRGHAGELMHMTKAYNFSLDAQGLAIAAPAGLESWLFGRLSAYMLGAVEKPLLTARYQSQLEPLGRECVARCLAESDGVEPALQRIWHLFLTQRIPREVVLSVAKFGSVVDTRLPYLDNELVDLLMKAPARLKLGETIQAAILRRTMPEFLDVVNVNTGTRVGAGRWAERLATFKARVLSKLRVPGYGHYEKLGLWLARQLRPMLEEILLGDRCLQRGVFNAETLKSLVEEHAARRRNHTYILMAALVFELGQREFIDGDPPPNIEEHVEHFA